MRLLAAVVHRAVVGQADARWVDTCVGGWAGGGLAVGLLVTFWCCLLPASGASWLALGRRRQADRWGLSPGMHVFRMPQACAESGNGAGH